MLQQCQNQKWCKNKVSETKLRQYEPRGGEPTPAHLFNLSSPKPIFHKFHRRDTVSRSTPRAQTATIRTQRGKLEPCASFYWKPRRAQKRRKTYTEKAEIVHFRAACCVIFPVLLCDFSCRDYTVLCDFSACCVIFGGIPKTAKTYLGDALRVHRLRANISRHSLRFWRPCPCGKGK